jgi:hypothetical protein
MEVSTILEWVPIRKGKDVELAIVHMSDHKTSMTVLDTLGILSLRALCGM